MSVFGNKETIPVEAVRIQRSVSKATIKPQKSACIEDRMAVEQTVLG